MKFNNIVGIYFSPTGNTLSVVKHTVVQLAKKLNLPYSFISYTLPSEREEQHSFDSDELVVFASPVYAGRLPNKLLSYVQSGFNGDNTPVIPIATYGNRSYDDALSEMCGELKENGFVPFAAAAMATEHVFSNSIATNRPDEEDYKRLDSFIDRVCDYLSNNKEISFVNVPGEWPNAPYYRPLKIDGQPANFLKAKPKTDLNKCNKCGSCERVCPTGAIKADNYDEVIGVCIKCQACVKLCPTHAKYFDDEDFLAHVKMLEKNYIRRAEMEVFLCNME